MWIWIRHGSRLARDVVGHTVHSGDLLVAVLAVAALISVVAVLAIGSTQGALPWAAYTLI